MSYLDIYKKRLQATGNNSTDGIVFSSKNTVKNNFSSSLFSELVLIDDAEYEVVITQGDKSDSKQILLKPDTKIYVGSIVKIKDFNYLIVDFLSEGINEIYPTATLSLCNESLLLSGGRVCTVVGQNAFGEDVEECVESPPLSIPCIAEFSIRSDDTKEAINLPKGEINVTIQFTEHEDLTIDNEFQMYGEYYKITGFDKTKQINGVGLLVIQGEKAVQ